MGSAGAIPARHYDGFEIDAEHLAVGTLYALFRQGTVQANLVTKATQDLESRPTQRLLGIGDQTSPSTYEGYAMKVELPFLAEGIEGGDVVQLLVHEGDQVTEGNR